tara:strand:- start:577 stop:1689 length:1113 start_codon:yes stop_codon:yes gene_type:complete
MKTINSNNYFADLKNKIYEIITVKNKNEVESMINHFNNFRKIEGNKFIGLDFEFNSSPEGKKIALFQINLQSNEKTSKIYLFYPPDLNLNQMNNLVNLLIDVNIKKILHGAESLDIPYLFKNIFTSNDLRNKFCNNLFDTRYMCEFYHLEKSIVDGKCKIYSLLRELDVINDRQLQMLIKNEEDMGPIYLVDIDVRKLNDNTMLYSAFDVLYLPHLLEKFPNNYIYMKLIPEITCFNYIDRYENIFTKPFSEKINKMNNYFMKIDDKKNIKLVDIFQLYYFWIDDRDRILTKLMEINYFKKFIEVFIKFIVYKEIIRNYTIYASSNKIESIYPELVKEEKIFQKIKLTKNFESFFSNIRRLIVKDIINTI